MRSVWVVIALAVLICGDASAQTIRDLVGVDRQFRVIAVIDGDTVDAIPAGEKRAIRLRIEGIDTPERGEPFSQQARNFTRGLLFDQTVRAEGRDVDRYGRLVARVRVAGRDTSVEILRAGLACHYTAFSSDAVLARAEADARAAGRGFWARDAAKPRCVKATQAGARPASNAAPGAPRAGGAFHGNTESHLYHASYCRNFNCRSCTRVFVSEDEARKAGYRPAGDCLQDRR